MKKPKIHGANVSLILEHFQKRLTSVIRENKIITTVNE